MEGFIMPEKARVGQGKQGNSEIEGISGDARFKICTCKASKHISYLVCVIFISSRTKYQINSKLRALVCSQYLNKQTKTISNILVFGIWFFIIWYSVLVEMYKTLETKM